MYDERNWAAVDGTLKVAPVLPAGDAPTVAATIYGYLQGSPPPWGQGGLGIRALAAEVVNAIPDAEVRRARGAAMDRHQIVALKLAALDDNRFGKCPTVARDPPPASAPPIPNASQWTPANTTAFAHAESTSRPPSLRRITA